MLQPLVYVNFEFAEIKNLGDFLKTNGAKESAKVKSLYENLKNILNLPESRVRINIAQGERIYRLDILGSTVRKEIVGQLFYIPEQKRLDIFDSIMSPTIPFIQFIGKKIMYMNYSPFLGLFGVEQLFKKLTNII